MDMSHMHTIFGCDNALVVMHLLIMYMFNVQGFCQELC